MDVRPVVNLLVISAQSLGVSPSAIRPPSAAVPRPVAVVAMSAQPALVKRIPFSAIRKAQDTAYVAKALPGGGAIEFSVGVGPGYELWVKFRRGDAVRAFPLSRLNGGIEAKLGNETYRLAAENLATEDDTLITAEPVGDPWRTRASAFVDGLIAELYVSAEPLDIGPVRYALLREESGDIPPSFSMIRRDDKGRWMLTYKSLGQLRKINWFLAIDGIMYGMRAEGADLAIYSKPVNLSETHR